MTGILPVPQINGTGGASFPIPYTQTGLTPPHSLFFLSRGAPGLSPTPPLPFSIADPPAQHQSPRLLRPGDPPAVGGRQPTALLQMLHHPMTLEPPPGTPAIPGDTRTLEEKRSQCHFARASEQGWGAL